MSLPSSTFSINIMNRRLVVSPLPRVKPMQPAGNSDVRATYL
nr:MAG TPA: hypothetical protein [Caudoviricetes sp.]